MRAAVKDYSEQGMADISDTFRKALDAGHKINLRVQTPTDIAKSSVNGANNGEYEHTVMISGYFEDLYGKPIFNVKDPAGRTGFNYYDYQKNRLFNITKTGVITYGRYGMKYGVISLEK